MSTSPPPVLRLGPQQMFFLVAQSVFRAGLTPQLEKVLAAVHVKLELGADEVAAIAREAKASIEGKDQRRFSKSRIMNAALHLAKIDGAIDDAEVDILLKVGAIFGMPEPKVRAVIRSRLAGDDDMMLSTTEASIEGIENMARQEAERMAMEAAKTGTQAKAEPPPAAQPCDDEVVAPNPEDQPPYEPKPTPGPQPHVEKAEQAEVPKAPQPCDGEAVTTNPEPRAEPPPAAQPCDGEAVATNPEPEPPSEPETTATPQAEPPPEPQPEPDPAPAHSPKSIAIQRLRALPPKAIAGIGAGVLVLGLVGYLGWSFYAARVAQQQADLLEKMIRDATREVMGHCRRGLDLAHEGKLANSSAKIDEAKASLTDHRDAIQKEHRAQSKPPPKHLLAFPAAQIPAFRALVLAQELEQKPGHFKPLDVRIPHIEKIVSALDESVSQLRALRRLDPEAEAEFERVAAMHTEWSNALDALVMKRKNDRGF